MADAFEGSPWGPWMDYGRPMCGAEEAVSEIIDKILTDGGITLWQKYLERKAFSFASKSVSDVLVSQLRMCFVHHDQGEPDIDEGWEIEEEPTPGEVDSWARMHLPVRRFKTAADEPATSSKSSKMTGGTFRRGVSRGRPTSKGAKEMKEKPDVPRQSPLTDDMVVDVEEERMRDAKEREAARRRDGEKKAREAEKSQETERTKVSELHDKMSKHVHTFDTEGNLIWVDDVKPERLPKLQENFGFNVKRDPRPRLGQSDMDGKNAQGSQNPLSPPSSPDKGDKNKNKKRGRKGFPLRKLDVEPEFTDGFSKLQHGQPPILETMEVKVGVTLDSVGKRKVGPEPDQAERMMSRKEYVLLAEKEVAMDGGQIRPSAFNSTASQQLTSVDMPAVSREDGGGPAAAAGAGPGAAAASMGGNSPDGNATMGPAAMAAAMVAAGQSSPGPSLPQIQQGRNLPGGGGGGGGGGFGGGQANGGGNGMAGGGKGPNAPKAPQKAPPAPPAFTRNRKFEALGYVRPPRYHVPQLGGPQGFGSAQPPLGATMGHGLMKHGSLKEAYFFPPSMEKLPMNMLRSQSDVVIGSARRQSLTGSPKLVSPDRPSSRGQAGDEPVAYEGEGDVGGRLRAEMSPAYRNFRQALVPADSSNGYLNRS